METISLSTCLGFGGGCIPGKVHEYFDFVCSPPGRKFAASVSIVHCSLLGVQTVLDPGNGQTITDQWEHLDLIT